MWKNMAKTPALAFDKNLTVSGIRGSIWGPVRGRSGVDPGSLCGRPLCGGSIWLRSIRVDSGSMRGRSRADVNRYGIGLGSIARGSLWGRSGVDPRSIQRAMRTENWEDTTDGEQALTTKKVKVKKQRKKARRADLGAIRRFGVDLESIRVDAGSSCRAGLCDGCSLMAISWTLSSGTCSVSAEFDPRLRPVVARIRPGWGELGQH